MECPSCGNAMGETAVYCGHCGAPLRRRCHICDANNALDAQSCQECGRTLRAQGDPSSAQGSAAATDEGRPTSLIRPPQAAACPRCGAINGADARCCDACGLPFEEGVAAQPETPAGFLVRLGAYVIDAFILFTVATLLLAVFSVEDAGESLAPVNLALLLLEAAYFTFPVARWGATPGKMVFRLRIVRADGQRVGLGQAFGRYLASILSRLILLIGYLMIAFRQDKRGLHDLMAETKVIYAPPVRR